MKKIIIVDGDDTLWATTKAFKSVYNRMIKLLHLILSVEKINVTEEEIKYYMDNKKIEDLYKNTFNYEMINKIFVLYYTNLCSKQGIEYSAKIEKEIYTIIDQTLCTPAVYPNAFQFLKELYDNSNFEVYLYTHGDEIIQNKKIDNTQLRKYFKGIKIEKLKKSSKTLSIFLKSIKKIPTSIVYYIGDSVKHDINPAILNGLKPVLILRNDKLDDKLMADVKTVNNMKEALLYVNAKN